MEHRLRNSSSVACLARPPRLRVACSAAVRYRQMACWLCWRSFDFCRVDAEIKTAKGRNAKALAAYRLAVLRPSHDVEDAFSTFVQQEARATMLTQNEASLTRARATSDTAYRGGVISLIEVLDADRRLLDTRDGAIQARAAASRGAVVSFRALGGGWDPAQLTT